jgi:hypothetical protein
MGLAGQGGIVRLEKEGRSQQQPGRVAAAILVEGDLPAHAFHLCGLPRVQLPGRGRDQQAERCIQLAGVPLAPGRGEQPLRTAGRVGGQQRRPVQEGGRRGQPPARLGSARRPFKLGGDVLIRALRGLGPVPRPAVRISGRVGGLRERRVHLPHVLSRRRPVGRRPRQRVPEPHPRAELRQPRLHRRRPGLHGDPQPPRGPPHQQWVSGRIGCRQRQQEPRLLWQIL